ncbi:hypothetical protein [Bosea sp. 117]|uniref:TPR end-of-group domain-containing protein n=1 Tax=Bosea sp. 117 TaxID=1125973 RepID=UPI00068D3C96|nr:hypothetical protein [Bosea sp. 117]
MNRSPAASAKTIPSRDLVRAELKRVQASNALAGSERLQALLGFLVEETLAGRGAALRETVIGNELYGREPAYDPRIDSAVRVEVRRLRRKLEEYYTGEGAANEMRIDLKTGTYAATFSRQTSRSEPEHQGTSAGRPLFEEGRGAAIAVLPFQALSGDPVDDSFAQGLTDELIFALGAAEGLHVASRGVTFWGIGNRRAMADIAAELDLDALIQGTVRRGAGRMRVTVEVSNARGFVVWSDRFEAAEDDLVDFEEKIAATMLNRLRLDSSRMRANEIRPGPEALDAFAQIARARQWLDRQTPDSLRKAMSIFEEVARTAPDYARSHSGIADCACDMFRLGLMGHAEARSLAERAAAQAILLDPSSAEAHAARATIAAWLDFNREDAEASFSISTRLGGTARARRVFGAFLTILERHEEAEAMFRSARELEPFSIQQDIAEAVCHYQSRRFGVLLARFGPRRRELAAEARFHLALADIFGGEGKLATEIAEQWDEPNATASCLAFARAELEAWLGNADRARRLLAAHTPASEFAVATLAAAVGDGGHALTALTRSIAARQMDRAWIRTDARFDRLRNTKDFDALMASYAESTAANR